MHHVMHTASEFKGLRKVFQGINSTTEGSIEKSKRRMAEKMTKKSPIVKEGLNK